MKLLSFSILLLCVSTWLMMITFKNKTNIINFILLILNIIFLLSIAIITIYLIFTGNFTIVPFWIYWILIILGIIIGAFAFVKKNIPCQVMSAGILLFTGIVAIATIGIILLILFVLQITFCIINWERYGLRAG